MVNQELLTFIKQELARGITESDLKASLSTAGWPEADISEAFSLATGGTSMPELGQPAMPVSTVLLGAPALLGKAWTLYKQRWTTFLTIMIAPALLSILVEVGSSSVKNMGASLNPFIFFGVALVMLLALVIINIWSSVALLHAIKGTSEHLSVTASYGRGARHILAFVWISILTTLIVMGGFMLLIIPGIIFAIWFMFATMVVVDDNTKGMNALLKSREYVRGRWWGTWWRMFFVGLIFIPIFIVLFILSYLLTFKFLLPVAGDILSTISTLFLTPIMMTYMFVLYENLKATRGSFAFAPTTGKKAPFIILAILVPILIIAFIIFLTYLQADTAKDKGRDPAIKSIISNIKPAAEVYFDSHNNYEGFCKNNQQVRESIDTIDKIEKMGTICNANITQYAISARLSSGKYFCVDSSQNPATLTSRGLKPTETQCPTE
ncbi:MAG: hypothetical protein AAB552_02630 [Patescibacteria group bacterium]